MANLKGEIILKNEFDEQLQFHTYSSFSEMQKIINGWKRLYGRKFNYCSVHQNIYQNKKHVPIPSSIQEVELANMKVKVETEEERNAREKSNYMGKSNFKKGGLGKTVSMKKNKGGYRVGSRDFGGY